ncbi:MAG TPA: class I SAM-dependent methyltransferase [Streptosporangiaceae bacterium]|nr:class I SAM-dependent methyltransferase [Streptosporangiaceae bacterium]
MELNPPAQYADDRNLRARQRLWQYQRPFFDIAAWVLDMAGLAAGMRVLDAGCGNGTYLRALRERGMWAAGCDLSMGMLRAVSQHALFNANVTALPVRDNAFDVVLAAHMLDLVPDRQPAIHELRRVLVPGGTCVVVANGPQHLRSLRNLAERAGSKGTPGWQMRSPGADRFTGERAAAQLSAAFHSVTCVRASANPVVIEDAGVAADYVASMADHYHDEIARPWRDVVEDVRHEVNAVINEEGAFITAGDLAAFVCR